MCHHEEGRDDPRPLNLSLGVIKLVHKLRAQCKAFLVGYYNLTPEEYSSIKGEKHDPNLKKS